METITAAPRREETLRERRARKKTEKAAKPKHYYDFTLLALVLLLVVFGVMMVTSASMYYGMTMDNNPFLFSKKQAIYAVIGIVAMFVISIVPYNFYREKIFFHKFSLIAPFYFACFALQGLVIVKGIATNGAQRWLKLPVIGRFLPSELSKLCLIFVVASWAAARQKKMDTFLGYIVALIFPGALTALVVGENLSTAILMLGIAFIILFVVSSKWWYFVATVIAMIPLGWLGITKVGYRNHRIVEWLHVDTEGYQIRQGLYAICSGGWFGKGLGNSVQKRGYIPEVHTDMILTVICEELGIIGVFILMLVYLMLLYRIYKIIVNSKDLFGSLLCVGVFAHVALQVLMNFAVITNSIPSTGVVLPFVSNGGTALMILLAEMGVVLSVSRHIEYEE